MERKEHKEPESSEPVIAGEDSTGASSVPAGRYYECIFCRRGFSTAQALGGHMNMHRRDRPKIRPVVAAMAPPPASRSKDGYHPYLGEQWLPPSPAVENYIVYFPGSSSLMESESSRGRMAVEKEKITEEEGEMEDLDLELRLGHGGRRDEP